MSNTNLKIITIFHKHFKNPYPSKKDKYELMNKAKISENEIISYFKNHRSRTNISLLKNNFILKEISNEK